MAVNPATAVTWTWADIASLKINIKMRIYSSSVHHLCAQLYCVVNYNLSMSPEIRTTSEYIRVNYTPAPAIVTLLAPDTVRFSNQRRTERFIFPDGTYCIGDYGRAAKKMTMQGHETTNAIQKMRQVQAMLNNPAPVTISGLMDVNQDMLWRLKDFDFNYDIGGDHYDWTADFTSYDYVEGSP